MPRPRSSGRILWISAIVFVFWELSFRRIWARGKLQLTKSTPPYQEVTRQRIRGNLSAHLRDITRWLLQRCLCDVTTDVTNRLQGWWIRLIELSATLVNMIVDWRYTTSSTGWMSTRELSTSLVWWCLHDRAPRWSPHPSLWCCSSPSSSTIR